MTDAVETPPLALSPEIANRLLDFPDTDQGNGLRLVALHGDTVRYCHAWKAWLIWDGTRWRRDDTQEIVRLAKNTANAMLIAAASAPSISAVRQQQIIKWTATTQSLPRLKAMVELAGSELSVTTRPEQFDSDLYLFNCHNGTLNLQTGRLHPHRQEDLITKIAGTAFDPAATAPHFERFLARVIPDPEVRVYMQRCIGYALTGRTDEECLWLLGGEGRNGKSKFLEAVRLVFGDYALAAAATLLLKKKQDGEGATPGLARLAGARFVTAVETEDGAALAETCVKWITGSDMVTARHLYSSEFEFKPEAKIFLATNHRPRVKGTDPAIWERIKLVPFGPTIPKAERDGRLLDKLSQELPGILRWAVEGAAEWNERGLQEPAAITRAVEKYRFEQDTFGRFLAERCIVGDADHVTYHSLLYVEYQNWCEEQGIPSKFMESTVIFTRHMSERPGIEHLPQHGVLRKSAFRGVALASKASSPDEQATVTPIQQQAGAL